MFKNLPQLTVTAPAKVNLHLEVKNKRPDGFHNLESIFLALDFGDILHFELTSETKAIEITMEKQFFSKTEPNRGTKPCFIPLQSNIIYKTLSLFREKTGFEQGLRIKVDKHIPIGGGLGGGSSDAAAALLALNKLADSPLNRDTLLDMAASLGSDVPFFIHETSAAFITGRGERIKPLEAPSLFFVLVNPGFPSDTAAAFKLLDEFRGPEIKNKKLDIKNDKFDISNFLFHNSDFLFFNDFLPVFYEREKSVYNKIISQLLELKADFASLSGAGSTCFGVFKDRETAEKAAEALQERRQFVRCCGIRNAKA